MTDGRVRRAAELLCAARLARQAFASFPADCRPPDEDSAYAVQDALHELLAAAGHGPVVGHKIGCTTSVMQAYMGIANPCSGGVFGPTVQRGRGTFRHGDFLHAGVECEVAVQLARDLEPALAPFARADVARAVGACMAAIEVVDDRYVDFRALDTPTLIADDFFGAACVLGPPSESLPPERLDEVVGGLVINGHEVASGTGADVLGHPLEALAWLANAVARRGHGLRAGELVLLGSVVQTQWVERGDEVVVENDPLGEVRARFL